MYYRALQSTHKCGKFVVRTYHIENVMKAVDHQSGCAENRWNASLSVSVAVITTSLLINTSGMASDTHPFRDRLARFGTNCHIL